MVTSTKTLLSKPWGRAVQLVGLGSQRPHTFSGQQQQPKKVMRKKTSFFVSLEESPSDREEKDDSNQEVETKKHPVITRVSLMLSPADFKRDDSTSISSLTSIEPSKPQKDNDSQNKAPLQKDDPRALLLLLHQKDLEIKGLKNAAQRNPSDRLASILQEIVKPRSKQPAKPRRSEDKVPKTEDLESQLDALKKQQYRDIKMLEDKLVKSQLLIRHLQETVKSLSGKSGEDADTESSSSADEGTEIARESFELWSESGTRIQAEPSDLRLRRIPKHTSFVDAFHRFGSISISDEDKDEIISEIRDHVVGGLLTENSSEESIKTENKIYPESSLAIILSQKSVFTSTDTKVSPSTSSLPSLADKIPQSSSVDISPSQDYWAYITAKPTLERIVDSVAWETRITSESSTDECKLPCAPPDSLKIVTVHSKGQFVRILNVLLNKEVDLSGYIIQQWVGGFPVSVYRFPFGTILPAQHHITVWAPGANLAHNEPPGPTDTQNFFRTSPNCITILCDRSGQTVSHYVAPHRFTAAAEAYSDNVDLSVDKFPISEHEEEPAETLPAKPERPLSSAIGEMISPSELILYRRPQRLLSTDSSASKLGNGRAMTKKKESITSSESSETSFFSTKSLAALQPLPPIPVKQSESSVSQESHVGSQTWQPLLDKPKARKFKTTLDTTLPMVALIGQKSARSKYGFKYMTYIPIITDLPLRRYCPPNVAK